MLNGKDEECCDRCGHCYPSSMVLDTKDGLMCLHCRRALGQDDEDVDTTDQDDGTN
jgi:hypothetical protein